MISFRKEHYFLAVIIGLGFIVRIWGLDFGLPFQFHQDEPIVVNHAIAYGTGDFNPHFFIIPPLCSYMLFTFYGGYFVLGKLFGAFIGADQFALSFFSDPSIFYLIARTVLGVLPGTLVIWLCYVLYKKLFGEKGALYAAMVIAFSFLCVANAHYAYTDSIMLVLILMVYISLVNLIKKPVIKNYLISAVLLGLAVGTKYNAALLAVSCYTAHVIAVYEHGLDKKRVIIDKALWLSFLVVIGIFVFTNPFAILDWSAFSRTITGGIRHHPMGWLYHLRYSTIEGVGLAVLAGGIMGGVIMFIKEKKWKAFLLFSFPAAFYVHLVFASQRFSRYALPLVPFLAICVSFLLWQVLFQKGGTVLRKSGVVAISLLLLIPTTAKSIKADLLFSGEDTRTLSTDWILKNIPSNTKIVVDHTSFRPQILQTKEQMYEKNEIAGYQEGMRETKKKKIGFLLKTIEGMKAYNVYFLSHKPEKGGQFLSTMPAIAYDLDDIKARGIEYVVINNNTSGGKKDKFIERLKRESEVVAQFSPYYDEKIRKRFDPIDVTCVSVGTREIFSRRLSGPCIIIYKLRY